MTDQAPDPPNRPNSTSRPDSNYGFRTRAVHAGQRLAPQTRAHATPIYATSTFGYDSAERGEQLFAGQQEGYFYSRLSNPTVQTLEQKLADLEGAAAAVAFSSGMAAASAILFSFLQSGDYVSYLTPLYGGSEGLLQEIVAKFGVTVQAASNLTQLEQQLASTGGKIKLVWLETPSNPTLQITDLQRAAQLCQAADSKLIVDNTFSTPYLTRPLEHGASIVYHSATKYLCGHGDALGGLVAGDTESMQQLRSHGLRHVGGSLGPFEAYLILRGLKTLPLRMQAHCQGALFLANELSQRGLRVHYPALSSHSGHRIAQQQMSGGYGGMLALDLGSQQAAMQFLNNLRLFTQAVSLGDVESLSTHPATTTHQLLGAEALETQGISQGLVRLSIGIEEPADLLDDILQALEQTT